MFDGNYLKYKFNFILCRLDLKKKYLKKFYRIVMLEANLTRYMVKLSGTIKHARLMRQSRRIGNHKNQISF